MAFDETYDEPEYTEVLVKSLDPGHPVELRYAHAGDAGADLVAAEDVTLKPFQRALVPTGMAIALPAGYVALVHPRSGLAVKYGVTVLNAPGTIDAGYRGEVKVPLINLDPEHTMEFHRGDRIAQLVIQRYVEARFVPASTLPGWWSGWLPQSSVRPGAEQSTTGRSSSPPKLRANPSSTWATLALAPLISPYLSRDSVPSSSPAPRARRTAPSFCIFILSSFA